MTTPTTPSPLLAFHGDPRIKSKYLRRVRAHAKADELVKGAIGQNGKGCAVWCTLNDYNHAAYETELGIPEILARLEDSIFENLPDAESQTWPERFLAACKPGADLSSVVPKIVIWQFEDDTYGLKNLPEVKNDPKLKKVCEDLVALYRRGLNGGDVTNAEWDEIYERARTGAEARAWAWAGAEARAWAWAGAWAEARAWAWAGAEARAWAWARAWAEARARARAGAEAWARAKDWIILSEKVLEFIAECPVIEKGVRNDA